MMRVRSPAPVVRAKNARDRCDEFTISTGAAAAMFAGFKCAPSGENTTGSTATTVMIAAYRNKMKYPYHWRDRSTSSSTTATTTAVTTISINALIAYETSHEPMICSVSPTLNPTRYTTNATG